MAHNEIVSVQKNEWNKQFSKLPRGSFFQTWEWGDFEELEGNEVERKALLTDGQIGALFQYTIETTPFRWKYLCLNHGPMYMTGQQAQSFALIHKHLNSIAIKRGCVSIRILPIVPNNNQSISLFRSLGYNTANTSPYPESTISLDLYGKEGTYANFKRRTKELIAKSKKHLTIERGTNLHALNRFYQLYAAM